VPLREKTRFEAAGDALPAPAPVKQPAPAR